LLEKVFAKKLASEGDTEMNFDRVLTKVTAGLSTGIRGDISIADFQRLDEISAHLLLEYEPRQGKPTGTQVEQYFRKTFEGALKPVMASCSIKAQTISIVAKLDIPVRAFEDSADKTKMTPILAGKMYLDNELRDNWEVMDLHGKKVLAKNSGDNIEKIIAHRRNRMFVTETPKVSLASLSSVTDFLGKGDTVRAYRNGEMEMLEITSAIKGGFRVKTLTKEAKESVIAKESVLDLQAQAADKAPNEAAKLAKYYAEAFGNKQYAAEMVKNKPAAK
jgi:hypothetical protein